MSTMTLEQARMSAKHEKKQVGDSGRYPDGTGWGYVTTKDVVVLSTEAWEVIDALLRERESAKAGVTDEMVDAYIDAHMEADNYPGFVGLRRWAVRIALEAVAPMLSSEPYEKLLGELLATIHRDGGHYMQSHGAFKATADAIDKVVEILASARVPDGFVLAPRWKLERASEVLERNGDEHGVGADVREMLAAAPKPEKE